MKALAVATLMTGAAAIPAQAAGLNLTVDPNVEIFEAVVDAENDIGGFEFNLFGYGLAAGSGFGGDPADLMINVAGVLDGTSATAALSVTDLGGEVLGGDLIAAGFIGTAVDDGTDVLELQFGALTGSQAAAFGTSALLTLVGEFGDDPFRAGFPYGFAAAAINPVVSPTASPIPLPATLPLLAAALTGAALAGRRRA